MSGGPTPTDTPIVTPAAPAPAAAVPAAVVAPASAAGSPAPAAAPAAAPVATATPVVATPAADTATPPAPAADAKPAAAAEPTSLLTGDAPAPADKPAADAAAPAEGQQPAAVVAEPQPLPTYEFKAPEGFVLDDAKIGEFNSLLGEFERSTGGDHLKFGEHGQKLIDFHLNELKRVQEAAEQSSQQQWTDMRDGWRTEFRSDPDLGGAREQATLTNCKAMIDQFGGNVAQRAELKKWMAVTGLGDNPHMIRLLSNVAKVLGEGTPVPATTPASIKPSRANRRYAQSMNGA